METENDDFLVTSDEEILNMIKLKPDLLKDDSYIIDRYNKIINLLKQCDDKQYLRLTNIELIKLLRSNPTQIKNMYIQKRILKIFQGSNIINIL